MKAMPQYQYSNGFGLSLSAYELEHTAWIKGLDKIFRRIPCLGAQHSDPAVFPDCHTLAAITTSMALSLKPFCA